MLPITDGGGSIEWATTNDFPYVIDHHTSFIAQTDHGPMLYIVGGALTGTNVDGGATGMPGPGANQFYSQVRAAIIAPDGGLLPYVLPDGGGEATSSQPFALVRNLIPLGFHAIGNTGNEAFLAGGIRGTPDGGVAGNGLVLRTRAANDGRLELTALSFINQLAVHATLSVVRGHLVLVGGTGSNNAINATVWSARLEDVVDLPDGGISEPFTQAAPLPIARTHHAAVVHDDHIYLIGGMTTGDAPVDVVHRSRHDSNGTLIGWDVAGTMALAPWTASAFIYDGGVFVVGGGSFAANPPWLDIVQHAPFFSDGGLGSFAQVPDRLLLGRAHVHQTPQLNGFVYSVGGRAFDQSQNIISLRRVDIGRVK